MFTTGNTHLKYRKHRVHSAAHKLKIRSSRLVLTTAGTDLDSTDRAAIGGAKNSSASEPLKRPILSLWNSRVHDTAKGVPYLQEHLICGFKKMAFEPDWGGGVGGGGWHHISRSAL